MDNIATETAHPADDGESPEVTAPLLEQGPQDAPGGPGSLFMVATPIGNVLDMSPRARQVLESADLVLAEDTRRSLQLCRELGVRVRRITSFHDHNEQEKEPEMLERLARGENLALISDAGTPVIADPGKRLLRSSRTRSFSSGHGSFSSRHPSAAIHVPRIYAQGQGGPEKTLFSLRSGAGNPGLL